MSGAAPGEVCGVCAAALRPGARFCGRCGAEQGLMVPRELGVGEAREPTPRDRRPLRARGLVVAIVGYFALFLPSLVLMARAELPGADEVLAIELLGGFVGLIGLVAIGQLSTLVPRSPGATAAGLAVVATGLVYGGVVLISQAVPWLFVETRDLLDVAGMSTWLVVVHVALVPAVTEEILFRGAIQGGLGDLMRDRTAIITSALLFAIAHVSIVALPHLFALGLVLGWVRVRSGSVWPGVVLHAGYNATILLTGL
ncbi:MAG: CPBP family intramembrane metalloprotease [Kofleriaceae bacterium]|nr:CPBP family intramembrane metalloprotease [Kofleriaceae bacterium]MCL4224292.1 CPBP family intramembrane metalloprotease [Myxococcales bacterium]